MAVTAEQARAELERRQLVAAAKAELARRQGPDAMLPSPDTDTRSTQQFRQETGAAPQPSMTDRALGTAVDVAKSFPSGVAIGTDALMSLPGAADQFLRKNVVSPVVEKLGIMTPEQSRDAATSGGLPQADLGQNMTDLGLPDATAYEPQTTLGDYFQTGGEFAVGGALARAPVMMGTVIPALGSETAGQLTEGTPLEGPARVAGALLAPMAASKAQKLISPTAGQLDPARMRAVEALRREGVNPTAGQVAGPTVGQNQLYREASTATGRQAADSAGDEFTRAAMRTIGEADALATPDVLEAATKRIGSVFDDAIQGVDIIPNQSNVTQLKSVIDQAEDLTSSGLPRLFERIGGAVDDAVTSGQPIRSDVARNWRSNLSALTKNADSGVRSAAIDALEVVDDIIENSLNAAGRPESVQQLTQARQQYRNLLAIERAAIRSEGGILTPPQLRTALLGQSRRQYTQGKGDLTPLTRNANEVLETLPQSGTSPRSLAQQITGNAPGGTGVGLGSLGLGADPMVATAVGTAATLAPAARNQIMSSPIGQQYFLNQLMKRADVTPKMLAGLLTGTAGQQQGPR